MVISPVTHTEVVDENKASTNERHSPFTLEIGKHNKNAPIKIKEAKLNKIYLAGDTLKNALTLELELIDLYYHKFSHYAKLFCSNSTQIYTKWLY